MPTFKGLEREERLLLSQELKWENLTWSREGRRKAWWRGSQGGSELIPFQKRRWAEKGPRP